jgi:hypothetical protein
MNMADRIMNDMQCPGTKKRFQSGFLMSMLAMIMLPVLGGCARKPTFLAEMSSEPLIKEGKAAAGPDISGTARFWLDRTGTRMRYEIELGDLQQPTEARLYATLPWAGGEEPVLVISPTENAEDENIFAEGWITTEDLVGEWKDNSFDVLESSMRSGDVFVVVRSQEYPDGAIGGQVLPVPGS